MQQNYEALEKAAANYVPLSPISFLNRAEKLHADRPSIIYGDVRHTWSETAARIRSVASGLAKLGIKKGDTVSVISPNIPCLLYTSDAADD